MKVTLAEIHGKTYTLELKDGMAFINGEPEALKDLTEAEIKTFQDAIDALATSEDPGSAALANGVRAAFLAQLLCKTVDDNSADKIRGILLPLHYEVQKHLGEVEE